MFFFFQAEDGIRDIGVTGVQTCALPIFLRGCSGSEAMSTGGLASVAVMLPDPLPQRWSSCASAGPARWSRQIGRASCRERVEISVVAESLKKKTRQT